MIHLLTVRSPHLILGAMVKTYWAKQEELNAENVKVVSVLPCTASKAEIVRNELTLKGLGFDYKPVDYVMTTRELAYLIKKRLKGNLPESLDKYDQVLGQASKIGTRYEIGGGILEAVLSVAYEMGNSKKIPELEFENTGLQNVFTTKVKIGKKEIKAAFVNGMGSAVDLIKIIENDRELYDFIEVMACPGSCLGGGGQPIPTDTTIVNQRKIALENYIEKLKIEKSYDSPVVNDVYEDFFKDESMLKSLCNTEFRQKVRSSDER